MRLNHNLASLTIYREHVKVLESQSRASEKISSGYKISGAKDDPNALASSERMRIQIRGIQMSMRNTQDGASMMQTYDGALSNVTDILQRMRELVVKAGVANTSEDNKIIHDEIGSLVEGISNIVNGTDFNGVKLINGSIKDSLGEKINSVLMQVGANVGEGVNISPFDLNSDVINKLGELKTLNGSDIGKELSIVDGALNAVIEARSKYGALTNKFESTYDRIWQIHDTIVGAESKVRDADIAEEMMNYTRDNVLADAGNAMMVQSNKFPQDILRILENVKSR
ncbi:MAG: flagellin [Clostridium sp.]|nr:flagellin [Clostridium sp.]